MLDSFLAFLLLLFVAGVLAAILPEGGERE